ncbi:unnamed protein product [Arctogadus glacialis]
MMAVSLWAPHAISAAQTVVSSGSGCQLTVQHIGCLYWKTRGSRLGPKTTTKAYSVHCGFHSCPESCRPHGMIDLAFVRLPLHPDGTCPSDSRYDSSDDQYPSAGTDSSALRVNGSSVFSEITAEEERRQPPPLSPGRSVTQQPAAPGWGPQLHAAAGPRAPQARGAAMETLACAAERAAFHNAASSCDSATHQPAAPPKNRSTLCLPLRRDAPASTVR